MTRPARALWPAIAVVWAAYLLADAAGVGGPVHMLLKALLMPVLAAWVVRALGARTPRLLLAGLVLATVGDVTLEFPATFLLGMAGFLGMQVCYIVGFGGLGAWPRVRTAWPGALAYAGVWLAANLTLGPRLGELAIPIAVYSAALCTMATVAAGVDRRVGVGGAMFLASDLMIALGMADLGFPGRGTAVMVTYLGAQYLITTGWVRRVDPTVACPA